ncbi:sugar kinase [Alloscardovia criceti]|uniref:sugar kinase n=1 Tax=Alloscardovia criceti TaxID=356828 RepID=UPI00036D9BC0|nr:sugar kinase [Alloscardovia criceti]
MVEVMTIGEPMVNLIADSPETYMEARTLPRQMAGAEFNVAIGVARLNHSIEYVTTLGNDWQGDLIIDYMNNSGIATDHIQRSSHAATGYQLKVKSPTGDPKVIYFRSGSAASQTSKEIVESLDFEGVKILHVTGIFCALTPNTYDTVVELIKKAREHHVLISFDPNPRPTLWISQEEMIEATHRIAQLSDLFMPGLEEAQLFSGLNSPDEIAEFYLGMGIQTIIIKLGDQGSALYEKTEDGSVKKVVVPSFQVEVVDTVGAGDGFAAGVITGLLENLSEEKVLERANAIGALQVTNISDSEGLPRPEQLQEFIENSERKTVTLS